MNRNQLLFCFLVFVIPVFAGHRPYQEKSNGVVFRGSYWGNDDRDVSTQVVTQGLDNTVSVSGYGGWIEFFSRIDDQLYVTWGFGSSVDVQISDHFLSQNDVHSKSVTPLVLGVQYHVLPVAKQSVLQPYVQFGAGPYWIHEAKTENRFLGYEETTIKSHMKFGANIGGGTFFRVSNSFALNFDMKYHLVDFDTDHDFSGFEVGFGCCFLWGAY